MKKIYFLSVIILFIIINFWAVDSCFANDDNDSRWIISYNNDGRIGAVDKRTLQHDTSMNHVSCWVKMRESNYSYTMKIDYVLSSRKYTNMRSIEDNGYSTYENKYFANKKNDIIPDSDFEKIINSVCDYLGKEHPYDHINDKWIWFHSSDTVTYNMWSHVYRVNNGVYDVYVKEISGKGINTYHCTVNLLKETIKYSYGVEKMIIPGTVDDEIMLKVKQQVR